MVFEDLRQMFDTQTKRRTLSSARFTQILTLGTMVLGYGYAKVP